MIVKQVVNHEGKFVGLHFEDLITIEDLHKAKEVLNRLITDLSISYLTQNN